MTNAKTPVELSERNWAGISLRQDFQVTSRAGIVAREMGAGTSLRQAFAGRIVLVTGNTGFKGSWLTLWLLELGATVIGFSIDEGHEHGLFSKAGLKHRLIHVAGDVRDQAQVQSVFTQHCPEYVFHLAAQPLVRESYENPLETFRTNVQGTVNLLEAVRHSPTVKSAVFITSDKCYKNKEWLWGYRESDELGGFDPYSASKGCAELAIDSYLNSFFRHPGKPGIASVRAGNVIGGGDWGAERLVPDCIRALQRRETIKVRNPLHTRPWQHVLVPLSGYLLLAARLSENKKLSGSWNFGPDMASVISVRELVEKVIAEWREGSWISGVGQQQDSPKHETGFLSLDYSKAYFTLGWKPLLSVDEAIRMAVEWYHFCAHAQDGIPGMTALKPPEGPSQGSPADLSLGLSPDYFYSLSRQQISLLAGRLAELPGCGLTGEPKGGPEETPRQDREGGSA